MDQALSLVWELDSIFPGGSGSSALQEHLDRLDRRIASARERFPQIPAPKGPEEAGPIAEAVQELQEIHSALHQAQAFISCLLAQDTADRKAPVLRARTSRMGAELQNLWTVLDERFLAIDDELWSLLLQVEGLSEVAEALDEHRRWIARKLAPEKEALAADLAVDGYHAWGELYNYIGGALKVPFVTKEGETVELSAGQAQNKMENDPDRSVRSSLFAAYSRAWEDEAEVCARALNHLGGFRLALYRRRGWQSVLDEPLERNRMQPETLEAMWSAVESGKGLLTDYLKRKAELLGVERLSFYDVDAPLGEVKTHWSYDEAAVFIVSQFGQFSPELARFSKTAFERSWIEAEDRAGKRPGGFCTSFPLSHESRIFMTFDNSIQGAATLAHELGHAYHFSVFRGVPYFNRDYPMNLAETASTIAEQVVNDAGIQAAQDPSERMALLDNQASRCVAFLMNIHARFLFELDFYKERSEGLVPVERLNELMLAAQKRAYLDALGEWFPLFWASKLHFYITGMPFYNFPYTFGYLFSQWIYRWAQNEPTDFDRRYAALLRDTGVMRTEALAKKHLGVDLTDAGFWREAVDFALDGVRAFLRATESNGSGS